MRIEPTTCTGCASCRPYCPVGAIVPAEGGRSIIDRDGCVECGVCLRHAPCPSHSFVATYEPWPRSLRALFSDPTLEHAGTGVPGRGTEEMKTSDVSGRYRRGEVGLTFELGRPGVGVDLGDVEAVTQALAELGVRLEPANPLSQLVVDHERGLLDPRVVDERVLSVVVECTVPTPRVFEVLARVRCVATALPTVMSVGTTFVSEGEDGSAVTAALGRLGLVASPNGKVNVGLGRRTGGEP